MSEERNEAGTPWVLFNTLHREYCFDLDVCATPLNAKLKIYWTKEENALTKSWGNRRVFCNPPFADIRPWLEHAPEPDFICFVLPVRSDRWWWKRWKPLAECHYLIGEKPERRPQFVPPPGIQYSSNPLSMCLFLFGQNTIPGRESYRSGKDGRRL